RLLTRAGFFKPSLEGGLPLLLLLRPSRRSNSAIHACCSAIRWRSLQFSASSCWTCSTRFWISVGASIPPLIQIRMLHQRPHVGESIGRNILKTPHLAEKAARAPGQL